MKVTYLPSTNNASRIGQIVKASQLHDGEYGFRTGNGYYYMKGSILMCRFPDEIRWAGDREWHESMYNRPDWKNSDYEPVVNIVEYLE